MKTYNTETWIELLVPLAITAAIVTATIIATIVIDVPWLTRLVIH